MAAYKQPDYIPVFGLGIVAGVMFSVGALVTFRVTPEKIGSITVSYTDFITVMLTAVTVVITILAVFIGALAVWGYSQFQKMTEDASKRHLDNILSDGPYAKRIEDTIVQHVSEQLQTGALRKLLTERVDHILMTDASLRDEEPVAQSSGEAFKD